MGRAARIKQAAVSTQGAPSFGDPLFERALGALRSNNHAAAIITLRQILIQRPDHPQASFHLATSLREQGQITNSIALFEKLLESHPRNVPLMAHLAETLRRAKRFADAETLCCDVIAIEPAHAEIHIIRGATRQDRGHWDEAIADYQRAILLDPRASLAHKRLVEANVATGRRREAIAAFKIAERDDLCDFELYRLAGDVFDSLGQIADGLRLSKSHGAECPRHPYLHQPMRPAVQDRHDRRRPLGRGRRHQARPRLIQPSFQSRRRVGASQNDPVMPFTLTPRL